MDFKPAIFSSKTPNKALELANIQPKTANNGRELAVFGLQLAYNGWKLASYALQLASSALQLASSELQLAISELLLASAELMLVSCTSRKCIRTLSIPLFYQTFFFYLASRFGIREQSVLPFFLPYLWK